MSENIISVDNLHSKLSTRDGAAYVLTDISMSIKKGSTVGVIGESGSGKTQLLLALTGNQELTPGVYNGNVEYKFTNGVNGPLKIYPNDNDDSGNKLQKLQVTTDGNYKRKRPFSYKRFVKKESKKIKSKVGFIPQDPKSYLNPYWTVETFFKQSFKRNNESGKFRSFLKDYLESVQLPFEIRDKFPNQISGGEAQRVMMAFVLSHKPDIIIGDELTTGVDVSRQRKIIELFEDIKKDKPDLTIILISHDINFLHHLVDDYFIMYGGCVVENISNKEHIFQSEYLHPYTRELINSISSNNGINSRNIDELTSSINIHKPIVGCPYLSKCTSSIEKCDKLIPEIQGTQPDSWQRCWRKFDGK
ncbi:MAG: ABC transporter ATP-binding protein [Candidatus Marinimicrobia bacterium]|nr:ABC transporter ATP-binding protein [Candidatus Neomarinimicrobiota bacterium]